MLKHIIIFLILLSSITFATESLKLDFDLHNVNKICIEPISNSWQPYHKIYITNPETIKFIINELNNIKKTGGIDTIVLYNVIFYQGNKELLILGLNMDLNYPGSSFIRQKIYTKDNKLFGVDDYLISASFFDCLKDELHDPSNVDKSRE